MTTRHLVDPQLLPLLEMRAFSPEIFPVMRAALAAMREQQRAIAQMPVYDDVEITERFIPAPEGAPDVRVLLYQPKSVAHPVPALVWMHGGGFVLGSADGDDAEMRGIVAAVGCAVVSVDYRLAPETPHPGPVEDCYAVLKWLYESADALGVDTSHLAVGGASAGGGLAATLALLARDRGEIPLRYQLLIYPMLDDRTVTMAEPHPYVGEFMWDTTANRFGWTALLNAEPGSDGVSPYAAAARAESLAALPPTYIAVGALDLFLEEDMEYARRLLRDGIPTELHVYPGAVHGFEVETNAHVSQAFFRDYHNALKRGLGLM